jgi:hypothetical protein
MSKCGFKENLYLEYTFNYIKLMEQLLEDQLKSIWIIQQEIEDYYKQVIIKRIYFQI